MIYSTYNKLSNLLKITTSTGGYGKSLFTLLGILFFLIAPLLFIFILDASIYYVLSIGIGALCLINGNNWLIKKRKQFGIEIKMANMQLIKSIESDDSIENILNKLEYIYSLIRRFKKNLLFTDWMYSDEIHTSHKQIFTLELVFLYGIVSDLEKDLKKQVQMHIGNLKNANSKISNTNGDFLNNIELVQMQKIRLERQISEFKKLDKILVKI